MSKKFSQGSRGFLEPITSDTKTRKFLVYDIESKADDSQKAGFTRPFLIGLFDPQAFDRGEEPYQEFRDEPHLRSRFWDRRHVSPGGCIDKLINTILVKKYSGYSIYAHNGGSFDHLFLPHWLEQHRDEFGFEIIPVQSSIQVLKVWRIPEDPEGAIVDKWEFLDSMKLMTMSLDKACKMFDLPTKLSHDLNMDEDDPSWSLYLKQDCVALTAVLKEYFNMVENRLHGEVGVTTASTAMKLFRKKYMGQEGTPERIPRYQHWPDCREKGTAKHPGPCMGCFHAWIRTGYHGGRTEILRMFGMGLKYFDINSSYVAAMRSDMPIGKRVIDEGKLDWRRHRSLSNPRAQYTGFCECTVFIPAECPIPPLPHKNSKTGKLCFPKGQFHGIWSTEELALLDDPLVNGRIVHVVRTVWFRLEPMFYNMMTELWKYRDPKLEGYDEGLSRVAKDLGNSTYGKFAMCQERSSVVFSHDPPPDVPRGQWDKCFLCKSELGDYQRGGVCKGCEGSKSAMLEPDGNVWYQAHQIDAPYIIPHVSSHITALARVRLWGFMRNALMTRMPAEAVGDMASEDVFFPGGPLPGGTPELIMSLEQKGDRTVIKSRALDGSNEERSYLFPSNRFVECGGKVFYCDTDSAVTNVDMPCSNEMGDLKDEYPGERLNYLAAQPKVYLIERAGHNKRVAEARALLERFESKDPALSSEDVQSISDRIARGRADMAKVKALEEMNRAERKEFLSDPANKIDPWKIDPIVLKPHSKVTMKGFPARMRTKENLETLRGGKIDWDELKKGVMVTPPVSARGQLSWPQLEKVRTLARYGFRRPPLMKQGDTHEVKSMRAVNKSFKSDYDKREIRPDGSGRTRAVILNEPVGGYLDDESEAAAE